MNDKNSSKAVPLDDRVQIAYKVVTGDMQSLGLRRNPNIITYPVGEWYTLPEEDVVPGKDDFGGVWAKHKLSEAKRLTRYMMMKKSVKTRIFKAYVDRILYENSCSLKTNGVFLEEEIHF